jgi:hypothetical protein
MPVDQVKDKFSLLRSRMAKESDTVLTFSSDTKLNAHAAILRLHSPRLARKLQSAQISSSSSSKKRKLNKGSSNTGTGATLKLLHMPGTSKADFLVVAQFLYPAVPLPKVSWDNLEVLLVEGRKWEMQVRALLQKNRQLVLVHESYGQQQHTRSIVLRCISSVMQLFMGVCTAGALISAIIITCLADDAFACSGDFRCILISRCK